MLPSAYTKFNEKVLNFIWQNQYFNPDSLKTTSGQKLFVARRGYLNLDEGPDFLEAKIKLDHIEWAGNIEIHMKSSDWYQHRHQGHKAYDNVILHVVYEHDEDIINKDGTLIPTLELHPFISDQFIQKVINIIHNRTFIACESFFPRIDKIIITSTLERALIQRLEKKGTEIINLLKKNNGDWEETCYQVLSRNMGFKVNNESFYKLAALCPLKNLLKLKGNQVGIEAYLFGMAGFLDQNIMFSKDDYVLEMNKEWHHLKSKFQIKYHLERHNWKFLRLRPANFPTIRIAQLASLINAYDSLFSHILEADSIEALKKIFKVKQSHYWQTHYDFEKQAKIKYASTGESSVENLIINTIAPLLTAYGKYKSDDTFLYKAISILDEIEPEENNIIKKWETIGCTPRSAAESQGMIEQYNTNCLHRECLSCAIGYNVITGTDK